MLSVAVLAEDGTDNTGKIQFTVSGYSGVYDGKEMQLHSTDGVDVNVRLKDGKFISAYFTGDDGTYSITCDEPLEANEIIAIVDSIVSVNS